MYQLQHELAHAAADGCQQRRVRQSRRIGHQPSVLRGVDPELGELHRRVEHDDVPAADVVAVRVRDLVPEREVRRCCVRLHVLVVADRRVGDVTIVTCRGRLVAGPDSEALERHLKALMPINPHLVLHLGEVDFIDSGGLGLLVRWLTRAQNAYGDLKVCAVSPKIDEVLRVTRLASMFQAYDTEAAAITDAQRSARGLDPGSLHPSALCVDQSQDVLAYLRELLKKAGYRVVTAANLPDALILLTATHPNVIVVSAELRAATGTRAADEFHRLANAAAVVELPPGFSGQDAGEAAEQVLQAVQGCVKSTPS